MYWLLEKQRTLAARRASSAGFTLLELIVTVAVLGILVVISLPLFGNVQATAKQRAVDESADRAYKAAAAYYYAPNAAGVTAAKFLEAAEALSTEDILVSGVGTTPDTLCATATWRADESITGSAGPGCRSGAGGPGGPGDGSGSPGDEEPPAGNVVAAMACGPAEVAVTDSMLQWSNDNRAAVAAGGVAKLWPGGDWSYIFESKLYTVIAGAPADEGMLEKDLFYAFSTDPATDASAFLSLTAVGMTSDHHVDAASGSLLEDIERPGVSSVIGQLTMAGTNICYTSSFENGKVSSSSGVAHHQEIGDGSKLSIYAVGGLPRYGTEKPSVVHDGGYGHTAEVTYHAPNGERWSYQSVNSPSLWHPATATSAGLSYGQGSAEWTNCFGSDCAYRISTSSAFHSIMDANGLERHDWSLPSPSANGASQARLELRSNGTVASEVYYNIDQGRMKLSRNDGPARYTETEAGGVATREYHINGTRYNDEASYAAAGGTGWR